MASLFAGVVGPCTSERDERGGVVSVIRKEKTDLCVRHDRQAPPMVTVAPKSRMLSSHCGGARLGDAVSA